MRAYLVSLALVTMSVASAAAQTLEITLYSSRTREPGRQFEVTRPIATPNGLTTRAYRADQRSTGGLGVRVGVWPWRRVGLDVSIASRAGMRSVVQQMPNDPAWYGQAWAVTVDEAVMRLAVRAIDTPGNRIQFAAGVTRLTFGGRGYSAAVDTTPLAPRTVTGASVGAAWTTRISSRVMTTFGLDDVVYRVTPATVAGDRVRRWTQHDLALSMGIVIRVIR